MTLRRNFARAALLALAACLLVFTGCQSGSPKRISQTVSAGQAQTATRTLTASPAKLAAASATLRPRATYTPVFRASPTRTATPTLAEGWVSSPAGRLEAPILMYHRITDRGASRYAMPIETFRQQMEYLRDEGYQTLTVSQLAAVLRDGGPLPEKPVALTFDDGYIDVYENAFPILKEMGFIATAYVITSTLEDSMSYGYMQEEQLKALANAGWEIGSHSVTHSNLNKTRLGIGNELEESKSVLEQATGEKVTSFSYPYGISSAWIKERVKEHGYENAVGVDIFVTHPAKRMYYLSRREVDGLDTLVNFRKLLVPGKEEAEAEANALQRTAAPETP